MNIKKPYEQLITEKLERDLPIPDMADAIWARIEVHLDAATEVDTFDSDTVITTAKSTTGTTVAILAGCLITIVVLFFLLKKSVKKKSNMQEKPRIEQTQKQAENILIPDTVTSSSTSIPLPKKQSSTSTGSLLFSADDAFIPKKDSLSNMPIPLSQKDSVSNLKITPNKLRVSDSVAVIPPLKKPRGVPMSNNDYKIQSMKKDSTER